jgi:N-hydroxyarylamine O-acetyltransferase
MAVDLDAYFLRIGFTGERAPTLETLRTIHRLHPRAIPYENLNALMKWPVPLDAASVEQKLVRDGRGGYCYEQNLLFTHVLKALGFEVRLVSGRAVWRQPENAPTARTHAVLHVPLDGQDYVADVGFGVATLTAPLRLKAEEEQSTPHEPWIITRLGADFVMKANMSGEWIALYRFDLQEQLLSDFELMNWYTATHPKSLFVNNLLVARSDDDCRYSLFNNTFTMRHLDCGMERRTLSSAAEMRRTLESVFLLTLPETEELDEVLHRFANPSG